MPGTLYDYTYTNPSGYSYKGQVVSDPSISTYNYVAGQSYDAPGGGSYTISGAGTPTAPNYLTYGGGGTANINPATSYAAYDYKFLYPDGSYYLGKVIDNGTYGYDVGKTYDKGAGTYSIYAKEPA